MSDNANRVYRPRGAVMRRVAPGYGGGRQHTGVDGGSNGAAGGRRDPGGNPVGDGKQVRGVHPGEVSPVHRFGYVTAELRGS